MGPESYSNLPYINLLLADDDADDRLLFEEALKEIPIRCGFRTASNGAQLMDLLRSDTSELPDVLFFRS